MHNSSNIQEVGMRMTAFLGLQSYLKKWPIPVAFVELTLHEGNPEDDDSSPRQSIAKQ